MTNNAKGFALFNMAFRPFFLGAVVSSIVSVVTWALIYIYNGEISSHGLSASVWHVHEMLFGYTMAIITGFLLTAIVNWTGLQTITGWPLALLFLCWFMGRFFLYMPDLAPLWLVALIDNLFLLGVLLAAAVPVFKSGQKNHFGLLLALAAIFISGVLFYLGVANVLSEGVRIGWYTALYAILMIIFIIARRVIPFFIKTSLGEEVNPVNRLWLDIAIIVVLLSVWVSELFFSERIIGAICTLTLACLCSLHLVDWYHKKIWSKPLLWVLYLGYCFICLGFALSSGVYFLEFIPSIATHALTYGGIGMITLGMMSRVILGHTGRDVANPPHSLSWIFLLFAAGAIIRFVGPLLLAGHYIVWIMLASATIWVVSMLWFLAIYFSPLVRPRLDGKPG